MGMFTDLIPKELTPQEQKWSDEAAAVGLTWLKKTRDSYCLYKCNSCGEKQEFLMRCVRTKNFRCKTCFNQKLLNNSRPFGVIWLNQTRIGYGLYRFKDCGHEQEIQNANIVRKSFGCQTCRHQKYIKEAADNGRVKWILQTKGNHGEYLFIECGHKQEIINAEVRKNNFKCVTCQYQKYKNEACVGGRVKWLNYLRRHHCLYQFLDCGHQQEIAISCVKKGTFICRTCEETWYTKPSKVYVHSISLQGETIIKVGYAQNLEHRIKGYGLPIETIVQTVLVITTKTGKEASDIETKILQKFKRFRAKNIAHIMTKSGSTECFDASKLSEILDFTKAIAGVK
jgi:hypothetical protein